MALTWEDVTHLTPEEIRELPAGNYTISHEQAEALGMFILPTRMVINPAIPAKLKLLLGHHSFSVQAKSDTSPKTAT